MEILQLMSSGHSTLKLTLERDNEGKLPFLDMTILRVGTTITTSWYTKPTVSGGMIDHASAHLPKMIFNVAKEFIKAPRQEMTI